MELDVKMITVELKLEKKNFVMPGFELHWVYDGALTV